MGNLKSQVYQHETTTINGLFLVYVGQYGGIFEEMQITAIVLSKRVASFSPVSPSQLPSW